MTIHTQDGSQLINKVEIISFRAIDNALIGKRDNDPNEYILGIYDSKKRCLQIISDIVESMAEGFKIVAMPDD